MKFGREVGAAILGGEALDGTDTATTLRRRSGSIELTDGPFAETAEHLGGFYLVEAPDLDQVVKWCALLPEIYSIEIRPCIQIEGMQGVSLDDVWREEWGRLLALLIARTRRLDLAEDALADAFERAAADLARSWHAGQPGGVADDSRQSAGARPAARGGGCEEEAAVACGGAGQESGV